LRTIKGTADERKGPDLFLMVPNLLNRQKEKEWIKQGKVVWIVGGCILSPLPAQIKIIL
jgi:hypothetical protein